MTQDELGKLLGISRQMAGRLIAKGMPRTSIAEAQAWRDRHLDPALTITYRRQTQPRGPRRGPAGGTMAAAQLRLMQARARRAEILAAAEEGRYLPTDAVRAYWEKGFGIIRSRLLAIPSRVEPEVPTGVCAKVIDIIEREIRAALLELSGMADEDDAPPARKGNGGA
jgi:phage terminase Nu1 subunit (DNA packaging protein)